MYKFEKQAGLDSISFDFNNRHTIDSIVYRGRRVTSNRPTNKLNIRLQAGTGTDSILIVYSGAPPRTGFGSFAVDRHAGVPIIWTISPPYGNRDWMPCKVSLDDKIDSMDAFITVPTGNKAAGPGILVGSTLDNVNDLITYHWKHRYPIATYLIGTAITNYVSYTDTLRLTNSRQVNCVNYVYPENQASARSLTPATSRIMRLYDSAFVPYPFINEKYGHAQFGFNGGMENQTMSLMQGFNRQLIAHELGHSWFGNLVTCSSFRDMWLNEGFAMWLEGFTYEKLDGAQAAKDWRIGQNNLIVSTNGGSVWVTDTLDHQRIYDYRLTYTKGSMLVHMLRKYLGDEAFFNGIRTYLNDSRYKYKYASVPQFKAVMETVSGKNLTPWFQRWFYGEGFPIYTIENFGNNADGSASATINIASSVANNSFNADSVEVRFYHQNGTIDKIKTTFTSGNSITLQSSFIRGGAWFAVTVNEDADIVSGSPMVSGVNGQMVSDNISLYPSPVKNVVMIQNLPQKANYKLYTWLGTLIKTGDVQPNESISVSELPSGSYLIKINCQERSTFKRFIKQ